MQRLWGALGAVAFMVGITATAQAQTEGRPEAAPAVTAVPVDGHGFGHGRGMGQYGALGYSIDHGWTWQQITDHFYGGTTLGALDPGLHVDALLKGWSGRESLVMVDEGGVLTNVDHLLPPMPGRRALRVAAHDDGTFTVFQGADCGTWDAGTTVEPDPIGGRSILVVKPGTDPGNDPALMLSVCGATERRFYRGELWVGWFGTTGSTAGSTAPKQHLMSHVWVEAYLRGVVPAESPASWGNTPAGMNSLAAQAIAARSYVAAGDSRYGWATTCDDIFCQVYGGFGAGQSSTDLTRREHANTDLAIAMTDSAVRRTAGGAVARTEFSSSTGGHTAGGAFPAVPDDGDDVDANPNHDWSVTIPVGEVESRLDAFAGRDLGSFEQFVVTGRTQADGGRRVASVRAELAGGDVSLTGNQFRSMFQGFGVKSDWFDVPPPTEPPPPPPGSTFNDTAGNAHEANIETIADAGIAGGYPDGGFHPNEAVSRGQMATFLARGYDLPAAGEPTFSDIDGDVHEANIRAVAAAGIAQGYPDGTYRPTVPLNRGQMAVFLARAEDLEPVEGTGGCDVDGHLYEGQIRAVMAAGIATGDAEGCFHPDQPVTRGQMATFLVRALGL
jgi:peptidoglycan hydrolase-like amidase